MTIDELNALTTLTATDEVPVWDSEESGEPTKKITASNLAASVKSLADLPNTTEMNAAIAQSTATFDVPTIPSGTSVFNCGKAILNHLLSQNMTVGKIYGVTAFVSGWDVLAGYCIKLASGGIRAVVTNSGSMMLNCNVNNAVYTVYEFDGTIKS